MSILDYTSYLSTNRDDNRNNGRTSINENIALANRPSEKMILAKNKSFCSSCSDHIRPASNSSFASVNGINLSQNDKLSTDTLFKNSPDNAISVTFKTDDTKNQEYFSAYVEEAFHELREEEPIQHVYEEEVVVINSNKPTDMARESIPAISYKQMPLISQFYFGSLTVVGLFILFRMIQKSK
jgi:hypothetical protein